MTTVCGVQILMSIYAFASLGANSILDLTKEDDSVHQHLFSSEAWEWLTSTYQCQYEGATALLDDNVHTIREIEKVSDSQHILTYFGCY